MSKDEIEGSGTTRSYKRRKVIVDPSFQMNFLYLWLGVAFGVVVLLILLVGGMVFADGTVVLEKFNLPFLIGFALFVVVYSLLLGLVAAFLNHRVAGAAYRLNLCMDSMNKGNLEIPFRLRKKDYLKGLAERLETHRLGLKKREELLNEVASHLEKGAEGVAPAMEALRQARAPMERAKS